MTESLASSAALLPPGPYTLQGVLDRNSDYIVPSAWRELGAAEALRRLREMRVRNLKERQAILERALNDLPFREEEMKRCAEDLVYFCTRYAFIWNSEARQAIPFLPVEAQVTEILYPFYYDQYVPLDEDNPEADKRNHMVEKPRKVGATYSLLVAFVWGMCFHDRWPCRSKDAPYLLGMSADTKETVEDREDPESHMGRVEQLFRALPPWMLPGKIRPDFEEERVKGAPRRSQKGDTFSSDKVSFPERKTALVVRAATRNAGRSKRYAAYLFDEEEFAANGGATVRSLMDATSCLWRMSSPNNESNSFYRDFSNDRLKVNRHRLRYTCIPWYDEAWLQVQKDGRLEADFQREILCNRRVSSGVCYWAPPWDDRRQIVEQPLPGVPGSTLWIGVDIGKADGLALEYYQKDPEPDLINCHGMVYRRNATLEWMIPFLCGKFPEKNLCDDPMPTRDYWHPLDQKFVEHVGALMAVAGTVRIVAGSDAAEQRMHADSFVVQMWRMWRIRVLPVRLKDKREAIDRVKFAVPYMRVNRKVNDWTPGQYDNVSEAPFKWSDVFWNYRKKQDRNTDEILPSGMPVHDRFSNPADARQYVISEMPRPMKRTPVEVERMLEARKAGDLDARRRKATVTVFKGIFGRRPVGV